MTAAVLAIPGSIDAPTGGYGYAREIIAHLGEYGVAVEILSLPDMVPRPGPGQLTEIVRLLGAVPSSAALIIDGLALGTYPAAMIRALGRPVIGLIHHPLGYEEGLSPEDAAWLLANEKAVLNACARVISSSATTQDTVITVFDVPAERVAVAPPGTERLAARVWRSSSRPDAPLRLLAVGSVIPRKGYDVLVNALARLKRKWWTLDIVGSRVMDAGCDRALREQIEMLDLDSGISLRGELSKDQLAGLYRAADIFVLPSRYEGYGMAFAEAMAHGLPVVAAAAGNVPRLVPEDAGLLVPVDDDVALAGALSQLMDDEALRHRLAEAGWRHAQDLPDWGASAQIIANVVKDVVR